MDDFGRGQVMLGNYPTKGNSYAHHANNVDFAVTP